MPNKLTRKIIPNNFSIFDFIYQGRPSKDQGDFGNEVGLADMACVNQFGETNNSKYYHAGVVKANDKWFVYLEWGRIASGKSWENDYFMGQDFQFVECSDETEARDFFRKQCESKNIKRLDEKEIKGTKIWVGRDGKDGYLVLDLATRERGTPDAYKIKNINESEKKVIKKNTASHSSVEYHKEILRLVSDLVGGTKSYARSATAATGITPTLDTINKVRNDLLPLAGKRLAEIGTDIDKQIQDKELIDISQIVATLVPRPLPRGGTQEQRQKMIILSSDNMLQIQSDLDTFESALSNEDVDVEEIKSDLHPHKLLLGHEECKIKWIDPISEKGKWLNATYLNMTNNRHSYIYGKFIVRNMFEISRPDRDKDFLNYTTNLASKHKNKNHVRARLQPKIRKDISDISDYYDDANVFLGIHGTKSHCVAPILQTNLRLPKSLPGAFITGAAFGTGIYWATDIKKSYGYTSHRQAYWNKSKNSALDNRGFFMFLADVAMGDPYLARYSSSWAAPPENKDSIVAYPDYCHTLQNDEHIIFDARAQRIRYLIEADLI